MEFVERTLAVLGPSHAGKATTLGCMLYKYGAIDMLEMDMFHQKKIEAYEKAAKKLKDLEITPNFRIPKYHVTVLDVGAGEVDCTIVVLSPDNAANWEFLKEISSASKRLIIVINKMDTIDWSGENFQRIVKGLGKDYENIPIIPISAKYGENIFGKSSKSPWYEGWNTSGKSGTTLLDALEISLQ